MKLWTVYVNNGQDYGDEDHWTDLMIGETLEVVEDKIKLELKNLKYFDESKAIVKISEVKEVGGYEILLQKTDRQGVRLND